MHNIKSEIFANDSYYIELTPDGNVYKYYYINNAPKNDTGNPKLFFSSPDIIDISINGSIAFLDKNEKVALYTESTNKQEEIGFVHNAKSLALSYNQSNDEYEYYVLTANNELYVKGSFSGEEIGGNQVISKDKFVKVEGIPDVNKIQIGRISTTNGRLFTQVNICNKDENIY